MRRASALQGRSPGLSLTVRAMVGVLAQGDPDEEALVGSVDGGSLGGGVVASPEITHSR